MGYCGNGTRRGRVCKRWVGDAGTCPHHGRPFMDTYPEATLDELEYAHQRETDPEFRAFDDAAIAVHLADQDERRARGELL